MRIKRFQAWRPAEGFVEEVASVPYDVVNRQQATALAADKPNSFCMLFVQRLIYLK